MIGGGDQLFRKVKKSVERWNPSKAYGHERKFQSELQDFLDSQLNDQPSGGVLALDSSGEDHVVSTERGISNADLAIDDDVGVEMKRNLTNSQIKKLRGQIEDYLDNYQYVIICACGIEDMDGWRDLKNKYEGTQGGLGMAQPQKVVFVHKRKDQYGSDQRDERRGGLFDSDLF